MENMISIEVPEELLWSIQKLLIEDIIPDKHRTITQRIEFCKLVTILGEKGIKSPKGFPDVKENNK